MMMQLRKKHQDVFKGTEKVAKKTFTFSVFKDYAAMLLEKNLLEDQSVQEFFLFDQHAGNASSSAEGKLKPARTKSFRQSLKSIFHLGSGGSTPSPLSSSSSSSSSSSASPRSDEKGHKSKSPRVEPERSGASAPEIDDTTREFLKEQLTQQITNYETKINDLKQSIESAEEDQKAALLVRLEETETLLLALKTNLESLSEQKQNINFLEDQDKIVAQAKSPRHGLSPDQFDQEMAKGTPAVLISTVSNVERILNVDYGTSSSSSAPAAPADDETKPESSSSSSSSSAPSDETKDDSSSSASSAAPADEIKSPADDAPSGEKKEDEEAPKPSDQQAPAPAPAPAPASAPPAAAKDGDDDDDDDDDYDESDDEDDDGDGANDSEIRKQMQSIMSNASAPK